jgi:hypothetical protein
MQDVIFFLLIQTSPSQLQKKSCAWLWPNESLHLLLLPLSKGFVAS